jgi:hypothetical protein
MQSDILLIPARSFQSVYGRNPLMSNESLDARSTNSSEKKISAGINRAFEIYGPNLAAFFDAVRADIKIGERKAVQMDLPLKKSK